MPFTFCPQTGSLFHVVNFILDNYRYISGIFFIFLQVNFHNLVLFSQQRLFILNNRVHSRCAGVHGIDESPEQVLQQYPINEARETGIVGSIHFYAYRPRTLD